MSTYLVTGAAGFIGHRVCEFLLEQGHRVVGIDNLNDAYDVCLKKWRLAKLTGTESFLFKLGDIRDRASLEPLFDTCTFEAVINLAARAGVRQSLEAPLEYFETNCNGAVNLLELCRDYDVRKFVLASSSSLYGKDNPLPYHEDYSTDRALSPYAASKKAAESAAYTYHYLYGIDVTIFRYFTVYGPAGRPDMGLFRFVRWVHEGTPVTIFGDGHQSRDFTYIDDIARGTIAGLRPLGFEIINLGSDTPVLLIDVIRQVETCLGKKADLVYRLPHSADVPATWARIEKANALLNWRPQVELTRGIQNLVDWYVDNLSWTRNIRL